jgi:transcriptional regulator with XRE-family HTH domain
MVNSQVANSAACDATSIATLVPSMTNGGMKFAAKLAALLRDRGLTQADLAELVGTNQPQISRWMDAPNPPKAEYLLRIARALQVSVDYLIDESAESPPRPLSSREQAIRDIIQSIGVDEAWVRLIGARESGRPSGENGRPPSPAPSPGGRQSRPAPGPGGRQSPRKKEG